MKEFIFNKNNKKKLYQLIFFIHLFYFGGENVVFGFEFWTNISGIYFTRKGDTLKQILHERFGLKKRDIVGKSGYLKKIKEWNPHIKNWNNLRPDTELYLEFPARYRDNVYFREASGKSPLKVELVENILPQLFSKWVREFKRSKKRSKKMEKPFPRNMVEKKISEREALSPREGIPFSVRAFYFGISNSFTEKEKQTGRFFDISKKSLFSLGVNGDYLLAEGGWISSGIYYSYWSSWNESSGVIGEELAFPVDYGLHIYHHWPVEFFSGASLYAGMDYEKASFLNINDYLNEQIINARRLSFWFLTLGVSKKIRALNKFFIINGGLSYSLRSSTENPAITERALTYRGRRLKVATEFLYDRDWSFHLAYKQYQIDGTSELSARSIALGVEYTLF